MADLKTSLEHMRGAAVKVGDKTYQIDGDGVCKGVSAEHAGLMLQNPAWTPAKKTSGAVRKPPAAAKPAAAAPPPAPEPEPEPEPEAEPEAEEEEEEKPKRGRGRGGRGR
jgi:hypothetical protein